MCSHLPLEKNCLAVGELPEIEGTFGCATPNYHTTFVDGVFSGIKFDGRTGTIVSGSQYTGNIYGYRIEFVGNQYHNNTAPCVSCFCWRRTA